MPGDRFGAALAIKFFLWPLSLWLAAIARLRASAASVVIAADPALDPAVLDLRGYVDLLRNMSDTFSGGSCTIYAMLLEVGAPSTAAHAATFAVGGVMLLAAWHRRSFALAIGVALWSPQSWLHYFAC